MTHNTIIKYNMETDVVAVCPIDVNRKRPIWLACPPPLSLSALYLILKQIGLYVHTFGDASNYVRDLAISSKISDKMLTTTELPIKSSADHQSLESDCF